ncbi:ubiquitin thioesterase OTUB1-like isoform X1 [Branchiostoma floridae]|uniref:Ubiquitin thioesterase n=1 Tax=Branchiostoma floridae TaxID=7739 RepID=A0A9J7LIX1_BRAFL|nr:ubiquitin thioesterase OTUB1-like isoform X1 [Branchiostoma floridae]
MAEANSKPGESLDKALPSGVEYDEAIMAQQDRIQQEIAETSQLIGDHEDLLLLSKEYSEEDNVYQGKIKDLRSKYKCFRRTRGDGNCFYRAFGFSYLERLLDDRKDLERFKEVAAKSKDMLVSLGFPAFTVEDFHDTFMEVVEKVEQQIPVEDLLATFRDQGLSDYLVVYLRLLTSGYLQQNEDFFVNFIESYASVKEFCGHEVEPMARESDHIHIIALTSSLDVGVRVEYMDRAGSEEVNHHDFPEGTEPKVFLLYRPGHYDILYK